MTGDASPSLAIAEPANESTSNDVASTGPRFPYYLPKLLGIFLAQNGQAFATIYKAGNIHVLAVGSRALNIGIREAAFRQNIILRKAELKDVNEYLQAAAESAGVTKPVWSRVAPVPGGIDIDLGTEGHERVRITAGKVTVITEGAETLFYRTTSSQPMAKPAAVGNLKLLKKYLNLDDMEFLLFIAWLSYTMAQPKDQGAKYLILVLQGGNGSGKSFVARVVIRVIDPRRIGVQTFPTNAKDLAIATQNAHVNCYDNVRTISQAMADSLCIASSGGAIVGRQLYTDSDQLTIDLHGAVVINGIHSFIDQPDLAQRCLPIQLKPLPEAAKKSEKELQQELEADLPAIQAGLFELIAQVFRYLPTAQTTNPERMIDFVKWLAAMEMADGIPAGIYQGAYSLALNQGQLDSLLDHVLAAAVLEFAQTLKDGEWSGTPGALLNLLNFQVGPGTQRSRDWPSNPIALSKRLLPLQVGLLSQGVAVELGRGKERTITIKKLPEYLEQNHEL